MALSKIETVLIMGAGTMGTAIAQAIALKGNQVYLVDQTEDLLSRARILVANGVNTMVSEELYTAEEAETVHAHITYATADKLPEIGPKADLVIESVFERPDVKQAVFAQLDAVCRPDAILCSNTSASNVFEFVEVSHPERFLITHWFNPAYLMKLVEVVKGPHTADVVVDLVVAFLRGVERKPCVINQYIPGFIVNRIANAINRECGYMIMNGWTTGEAIDEALRSTSGIRYAFEGPLALNDVVGWDLILTGCHDVYASLCNDNDTSRFAQDLVNKNTLGVKTGKGVFDYSSMSGGEFMAERSKKIIHMYKAVEELYEKF